MFPSDFITLDRIGCGLEIASKKRMLQQLGEFLAAGQPGLVPAAVFDRLLERERLGSTGLGHGIALPHARMAQVRRAVGAFVQLRAGIDFDAVDDRPVDLAFALLVPQEATEEHLQLLAQLAAMFGNEDFCAALRQAQDAAQLLAAIQGWEANTEIP